MRTRLGSLDRPDRPDQPRHPHVTAALLAPAPPAAADPPGFGGDHPVTELTGQYDLPRTEKREDLISVSKYGLRFVGGGAGNRLTVTEVGDQVRYVDRAATPLEEPAVGVPPRSRCPQGIGAQCRVPAKFKDGRMFLEIYPRLGNDRIDGHTLSGRHRMWVLADAGNDQVSMGAGSDFANGAFDDDTISGGGGDDWIRAGNGHQPRRRRRRRRRARRRRRHRRHQRRRRRRQGLGRSGQRPAARRRGRRQDRRRPRPRRRRARLRPTRVYECEVVRALTAVPPDRSVLERVLDRQVGLDPRVVGVGVVVAGRGDVAAVGDLERVEHQRQHDGDTRLRAKAVIAM